MNIIRRGRALHEGIEIINLLSQRVQIQAVIKRVVEEFIKLCIEPDEQGRFVTLTQ
ncbi:hypothetical protein [Klebsiella aerogenes]|uniref:Uncharacterized protein n=1 Tax=Klebsiella aerogenes TaxID=548 RepID=A0AAP9U6J8_KLEAE|nr:hypothetical protein [Klebsiella aerogenes]QMR41554.1 hypothetical protein HV331_19540 [Klebsiella aerogenes]